MRQILLLVIFSTISFSQVISLYSQYGIGTLENTASIRLQGMANTSVTYDLPDLATIDNPAGLSKLELTRVEFGTIFSALSLKSSATSSFYSRGNFSGFTIGIPISRKYGIGVASGIVPLSNVNYEVSKTVIETVTIPSHTISVKGTGGLNKIFLAASYNLPLNIRMGAALNYVFGSYDFSSKVAFTNGYSSGSFEKSYQERGTGYTIGIISPDFKEIFQIEELRELKVGFTLNGFSSLTLDTSVIDRSSIVLDTLSFGEGKTIIPSRINFGVRAALRNNLNIALEFQMQNWSNFRRNNSSDSRLVNSQKFSLGVEYRYLKDQEQNFDKVMYRAGVSYEKTPYLLNGVELKQLGLTLGLSTPIGYQNYFDIALQYYTRGTTDSGLLSENILQMSVGLSLGELWFTRQER